MNLFCNFLKFLLCSDFEKVFKDIEMDDHVRSKLEAEIRRRLTPQPVKVIAEFEIKCLGREGIDAIKEALKKGEEQSTENIQIVVSLIAPPLFTASTTTLRSKQSFGVFDKCLKAIEDCIKSKEGGSFLLKKAPEIVGKKNEREIQSIIREMDQEDEEGEQYILD